MDKSIERIKVLTDLLNRASKAYYMEDTEIMSNLEYDKLYDELAELEKETGFVAADSPTQKVGYEVVSFLPKETHEFPMLSLDKTKSTDELAAWLGDQQAVLSWKMDGLTVVLTYQDGKLEKAITRGNGYEGEVITPNARTFKNVPQSIPFKGKLTIRGEAVIRYSDFNRINDSLPEGETKYKNPRNLCSGSVRQLNSEITASRNVYIYVFALVEAVGVEFHNSRMEQFAWLSSQGFDTVEHVMTDASKISQDVAVFSEKIVDNDFPSDGLVLILEDIAYGQSLGNTAKFPRNAIAFKWADELKETHLLSVEWSASRTGLINPIAAFEPVELEGTTVSRASLHNVSILRALQLGIGDEIEVYKANMIIPQIAENLTRSDDLKIPETCPVCGGPTKLVSSAGVASLYCVNPQCQAKHIKRFAHFAGRDAMNIEGLSEATLEKFVQAGMLHSFKDIYHLDQYREQITAMEGFGERSCEKLKGAIEKSRNVTLPRLIYSLGIPNVGLSAATLISDHFQGDLEKMLQAEAEDLKAVDGIGPVIAESFTSYFADESSRQAFDDLVKELHIAYDSVQEDEKKLAGLTFVITGAVVRYKNRNELKNHIISLGGKAAGSVSSKTDYLINNDASSASSKNKKAKELGVKIITEDEFIKMIG